ncbi:hypothetical protein AA0111_g2729 [Alternaria arborescens]|uniref:hypothetical protein n=1 Tax=Alternaria arborescens TaxID=156630 RepID=UPI00107543E9|nr:hypothetical protein AA0111_g2729 [Alternaria arborescens]RYO36375.1 hypothetical protein AA0111_g2729 [Alternaria arborescens]
MIGDPEFVILKYQSWLDTAKFENKIFGSIVKEYLRPTNNYVPDSPLQYNSHDFQEGTVTDFVLANTGAKSHEGNATLESVAGLSFKGSTESSVELNGKLIRYKRLQQHDQFWSKLKADRDVKAIVPRWTSRYRAPVCLVVGIMICEEVELLFDEKQAQEREVKGQLPIGKITLAAGVPNPTGSTGDPQIGFNTNRQVVNMFKGEINESRIFALELKKITTVGWIQKDLKLRSQGPDVDSTRLAAGESDEEDEDDERLKIEEFVLGELSAEDYGKL